MTNSSYMYMMYKLNFVTVYGGNPGSVNWSKEATDTTSTVKEDNTSWYSLKTKHNVFDLLLLFKGKLVFHSEKMYILRHFINLSPFIMSEIW